MKTLFIVMTLLGVSQMAHAGTDYTCLNNCVAQGYRRPLCVERCSYNSGYQQPAQPTRTDYTCLNDCVQAGYNRNLCKERCSY